jgi:hypothetical protein
MGFALIRIRSGTDFAASWERIGAAGRTGHPRRSAGAEPFVTELIHRSHPEALRRPSVLSEVGASSRLTFGCWSCIDTHKSVCQGADRIYIRLGLGRSSGLALTGLTGTLGEGPGRYLRGSCFSRVFFRGSCGWEVVRTCRARNWTRQRR